jgi:hypothetical protein
MIYSAVYTDKHISYVYIYGYIYCTPGPVDGTPRNLCDARKICLILSWTNVIWFVSNNHFVRVKKN